MMENETKFLNEVSLEEELNKCAHKQLNINFINSKPVMGVRIHPIWLKYLTIYEIKKVVKQAQRENKSIYECIDELCRK